MKNNRLFQSVAVSLFATMAVFSQDAFATGSWGGKDYVGVPAVQWSPCFQEVAPFFECATYEVPLDHSRASRYFYLSGHQPGIEVALIRIPATDPANKIGSLFLNPGGPGGSGVNLVLNVGAFLYSPEVRAKFDIVSFDPRGTNRSSALSCFTSFDLPNEFSALPIYPDTVEEVFAFLRFDRKFRKACRKNAGPILDNMTTADVARDMDIFREAVGDDMLTYAGYSYGSFLGVTYANLFPDRVRALIVDGVLDPIQWTTGDRHTRRLPVSTRLRSDAGAQATLEEFFRLCELAGLTRCAFAGDSGLRYEALVESVDKNPIVLINPDGSEFIIDNVLLISATLGALYNPFAWEFLAQDLAFLEGLATPVAAGASLNVIGRSPELGGNPDLIPQTIEAFPGVLCSDSSNPSFPFVWPLAAIVAEREYGYFGPTWTWSSSPCARWPASKSSRYAGPFTRYTANPVLVTGPEFDPATRFEGAVTVANLLPNSQLLTVQGWGHTSLFLSFCADQIASNYLVNVELPDSPTSCQVDFPPFNLAPGEVYTSAAAIAAQRSGAQSLDSAARSAAPARSDAEQNRARAIRAIRGDRPRYQE